MKYLVTGGAGFIGSDYVRLLAEGNNHVIVVDSLAYSGRKSRIQDLITSERIEFHELDICNRREMSRLLSGVDAVVNFAALTHVDNSNEIGAGSEFIRSNVEGVTVILDCLALLNHKAWFHQVSTDEVYGQILFGSNQRFVESDALQPRNTYSATKAAAEHLIQAYVHTHGLRASISRCCNNMGPNQHEEKFVPKIISQVLRGKTFPVYGRGEQVREWIHVRDHNLAISHIIHNQLEGVWNVGTGELRTNADLAEAICHEVNEVVRTSAVLRGVFPRCPASNRKKHGDCLSLMEYVEDRPGHDFMYALDSSKLQSTGWHPYYNFARTVYETVFWSVNNLSAETARIV